MRCDLALCSLAAFLTGLALLPVDALRAQVRRPEAMRRTVAFFDFERPEQSLQDVPQHWVRAQNDPPYRERPGFPQWNEAAFDDSVRAGGESSVRLPTRGGGAALRLVSGAIPVLPGSDYTVRGMIRTWGLEHARARIMARLLDAHGAPIDGAVQHTELVRTSGEWREVAAALPSAPDEAAWVQLELQLLQPRQLNADARSEHETRLDDVSGAAWFDNVGVYLAPKMSLSAASPDGVFLAPDRPQFIATVRDPTGEPLRAVLDLHDIDGALRQRVEREIAGGAWRDVWRPPIETFGWRSATLRVFSGEDLLGRAKQDVVWLPPGSAPSEDERRRFGAQLEMAPPRASDALVRLVETLGVGAVDLPVWSRAWSPSNASDSALESLIDALLERRLDVTLALEAVPPALAAKAGPGVGDVLSLLTSDSAVWRPALEDLLTRFGQRVRRWRLGADESGGPLWKPDLRAQIRQARRTLAALVLDPVATTPWPLTVSPPEWLAAEAAVTMAAPYAFRPDGIPQALEALPGALDATIVIEPPAERYGARARAAAIVRRAAQARRTSPRRLSIRQPWTWRHEGGAGPQAQPSAMFAAWRQVIQELAGRRYLGEAPAPPGATALAFEGPTGDVIVAWNDWAEPEDAVIEGYLGAGPVRAVDIFGNEIASWPAREPIRIALRQEPIYLEVVDARLTRFLREFRMAPSFIPAAAARRPAELGLTNPWSAPVSGVLRVVSPESWDVEPRVIPFSLAPGESEAFPITVALGVGEEAGPKRVVAEARLTGEVHHPVLTLETFVELGMPGVELSASAHRRDRAEGDDDIVIALLATNTGDEPVSLTAFAQAAGFTRQQAPISDLAPGASTARRFVFPEAAQRLAGERPLVGLIESDGLLRLNKRVDVPVPPPDRDAAAEPSEDR